MMTVGTLLLALRLPGAETLKDKRRVIRGMIESMRRRYGVSAAEVDDLSLAGNATIGVAFVSGNQTEVENTLNAVLEFVEAHVEIELYDLAREFEVKI